MYTKAMCHLRTGNSEGPFYVQVERQMDMALSAVLRIERHIRVVFARITDNKTPGQIWYRDAFMYWLLWIEDSLGQLSESLQDITSSITHRRYRNASSATLFHSAPPSPKMRLSEVHLDYADTYRVINSIVGSYYNALPRRVLPACRYGNISQPIVVISRGRTFSWEPLSDKLETPIYIYNPAIGKHAFRDNVSYIEKLTDVDNLISPRSLRLYARYMVSLSRVVGPRYFPVVLRYAPLMAHELFHPIIRIAEIIAETRPRLTTLSGKVWEREFNSLSKKYGAAVTWLTLHRLALEHSVFSFLKNQYPAGLVDTSRSQPGHIRFGFRPAKIKVRQRADQNTARTIVLENKAFTFTRELMADLAGLAVAHQSYVASLIFSRDLEDGSGFTMDNDGALYDRFFGVSTHPPMKVRAEILIQISEELGFKKSAILLRAMMDDKGAPSIACEVSDKLWNIWDGEWWDRQDVRQLIYDIIAYMQRHTARTPLYSSCSRARGGIRYYDEELLHKAFDVIVDLVHSNQITWDARFIRQRLGSIRGLRLPSNMRLEISDVLNAMWYSYLMGGDENAPPARLQWRLALRKNFGGDGGQY